MQAKTTNKVWALVLSLIMLLTLIPFSPISVKASADSGSYVLDVNSLTAGDYVGKTVKAGTDNFFTVKFGDKGKIDTSDKTFDDGYVGKNRLNFGGKTTVGAGAREIEFKTTGAAEVKVWWVSGGDNRFVQLYSASKGANVDVTKASVKSTLYIDKLTAPEAGTYQITCAENTNYIFKIEVTPKVTTKEYVLDANSLSAGDAVGTSPKAGTDNYFTIYFGDKGKVDTTEAKFDDGYPAKNRINFGGGTTYSKGTRYIEFTAAGKGSVKVWWVSGGDGRYVDLYSASKDASVAKTDAANKNVSMISTLKFDNAGKYFIGAPGGTCYILKVQVTEGESAEVVRAPWKDVAAPAITAKQDNGSVVVTAKAVVGANGGDDVIVTMYNEKGELVDTKRSIAEKDSHDVTFNPTASGKYTFKVELNREGEEAKKGTDVATDFILPLGKTTIASATSKGDGKVELVWQAVPEATSYKVYVDGKEVGTSTTTTYKATGLTVGKKYSFTVAAVRGSEVGAQSAAASATVTKDAQQTWGFCFYGTSTGKDNNFVKGDLNADGKVTVVSNNGKGKFQEGSNDGLAFYYTAIPTNKNFTLRAKVHIDTWTLSSGQEGFGLMALDSLPTDTVNTSAVFWSNSYRVGAQRIAYWYDAANKQVVYDKSGDKYQMNIGIGVQTKLGMNKDNIADVYKAAAGIVQFGEYPLETLAAQKNGAGTYCTIGNCTNPATFKNPAVAEITDFIFEIQRNNTGYFLSYYTPDGKLVNTQKFYDPKALDQLDSDNVYVGFAAARNMEATVSDVTLTTIDPKDDKPAEAKPKEKVKTNLSIKSAAVANSENYTLTITAGVKGTAQVSVNGAAAATIEYKNPGEFVSANVKVADGSNKVSVKFTPDAKQDLGEGKELASTAAVTADINVAYTNYFAAQKNLYVSPKGTKYGNGGPEFPLDLYTAVAVAQPGQTIVLMEGTYKLSSELKIYRGMNGTKDAPIKMVADPEAKTRPVLDFQSKANMMAVGDYWYFSGFDITKSADGKPGLYVSGSNCTYDNINAYTNGDCGIYIRSEGNSADPKEWWPKNNLILNCTAFDNADATGENADGFAAKFTVGAGNVFDGCVSYNNCDDGWDLYARGQSIESVTLRNCVAYRNGQNLDGSIKGNGNGFKLGGENMPGAHVIENCVAFENNANGITSNSCPDIKVKNCTSYKNGAANIALYTGNASADTNFEANGVISYKGGAEDSLKPQGAQDKSKYDNATNHYNGTGVTDAMFKSLDFKGVVRKADGTVDLQGYLELTDKAPKDAGARIAGEASAKVEVTADENLPAPRTGVELPVIILIVLLAATVTVLIARRKRA